MHSLNHSTLGQAIATERTGRTARRALRPPRPERPPSAPLRGRIAFLAGRIACRLDREMARRAVI